MEVGQGTRWWGDSGIFTLLTTQVQLYGWQTFKRVGASLTINRIYKIVLTLSITIQLSLFFMVVTVSLWIDQLLNSAIGDVATFTVLYKVSSFITLAVSQLPLPTFASPNAIPGPGSLAVPWVGLRPPRAPSTNVRIPCHLGCIPCWMGCYVFLDNIPLDLRNMALLFGHGICIRVLDLRGFHPRGHLPIQL